MPIVKHLPFSPSSFPKFQFFHPRLLSLTHLPNQNLLEPTSIFAIHLSVQAISSSSSHSGLIEEGCRLFGMMVSKYKIQLDMEQWPCIIDMLGRDGRLGEAYEILKSGLNQNSNNIVSLECSAVWGALLSACSMNMDLELGEIQGKRLSKLEPDNCGYHSLLSNLFSSIERWDEAAEVRKVFGEGKLMNKPGVKHCKLLMECY